MFVESLRDQFKFAYERVRCELQKSVNWQKVGYDTGLKTRFFQIGDKVVRLHEPLSNVKLASNWDGPFMITRVISDTTVVIRSSLGRLYKSNVARLRVWRGRALSTELYGLGVEEVLTEVESRQRNQVLGKPKKRCG